MTKTVPQMLAELNVLRTAKGLPVLKSWKTSTVKLAECLAKMGGKIEATPVTAESHAVATGKSQQIAEDALALAKDIVRTSSSHTLKQSELKKFGKTINPGPASRAPVAKAKGVRTTEEGEVHLTAIAASLKIDPKSARAIARQHKVAVSKLQVSGKKYVFTKANVAAVKAILETPKPKK